MQIKRKHCNISKYVHKIQKKMYEQMGKKLNVTSAKTCAVVNGSSVGLNLQKYPVILFRMTHYT